MQKNCLTSAVSVPRPNVPCYYKNRQSTLHLSTHPTVSEETRGELNTLGRMCYPVAGPARPAPQPVPAPASKRRWAVVQLARRVRGAGAELRQRVRHHASRAGLRVRRAQRWALSLSLAQLAVPLLLAAFLLLLHPHREIQVSSTLHSAGTHTPGLVLHNSYSQCIKLSRSVHKPRKLQPNVFIHEFFFLFITIFHHFL